ncbi:hypothetical protein [Larkinella rosea]|uniref:Uncharacterized protein n=1 Tax=Larkinella rosea TaxID=2025312 RepID=A0A3P1BMX6_9BACT|nr:hypothetical protein [Larkinella rosea]RRB02146.1 hypothetical protein EHT25_16820 [Larkinella rosea]
MIFDFEGGLFVFTKLTNKNRSYSIYSTKLIIDKANSFGVFYLNCIVKEINHYLSPFFGTSGRLLFLTDPDKETISKEERTFERIRFEGSFFLECESNSFLLTPFLEQQLIAVFETAVKRGFEYILRHLFTSVEIQLLEEQKQPMMNSFGNLQWDFRKVGRISVFQHK